MKSTGEVMGVADNFRRGICQGATCRRTDAADAGHRLHQRQRSRQASVPSWRSALSIWASSWSPPTAPRTCWKHAGLHVERVYKVKEGPAERGRPDQGRPHPAHHQHAARKEPWFDEKAIRRAAVTGRFPPSRRWPQRKPPPRALPLCNVGASASPRSRNYTPNACPSSSPAKHCVPAVRWLRPLLNVPPRQGLALPITRSVRRAS